MAAWLLVLPIIAAPIYQWDLGGRTELRMRTFGELAADGETERAFDWVLAGQTGFSLNYPRATLSFGYAPSFSYTDFTGEPTRQLVHSGAITGEWRARRLTLSIAQTGSYGEENLSPLTGGTITPPVGELPGDGEDIQAEQNLVNQNVRYWNSTTAARVAALLTRRHTLSFTATYGTGGGLDDESKVLYPVRYAVTGSVGLGYAVSRRDSFTTAVSGEHVITETPRPIEEDPDEEDPDEEDPDVEAEPDLDDDVTTTIVRVTEAWNRQWTTDTDSTLTLGVNYVPTADPGDPLTVSVLGAASLNHTTRPGAASTVNYSVSIYTGTNVDRLTGRADQRVGGTGAVTWARDPVEVFANVSTVRSVDSNNPDFLTSFSANCGVRVSVVDELSLEAGSRFVNTTVEDPTTVVTTVSDAGFQWAAYVAATLAFEPITL